MPKTAIAIACHPDDIEFMMVGTLIKLKEAGYEIHYLNIANGSLDTNQYDYETIVRIRREEAIAACKVIGAHFHESISDDMEVAYNLDQLSKVVGVIRRVKPEIVLTHGPYDYMEDHVSAGRLAVSAAFSRGMVNFKCTQPAIDGKVTVYHSMPHSLTDQLRRPVIPGLFVDISTTIELKKQMLSCHRSQKEWLDVSQGNDAYLIDMVKRGCYFGKMSERYEYAEGWIRHSPVGFCADDDNPLIDVLGDDAFVNTDFEEAIKLNFS
ncbi:MAG: LmbE family protein [Lentisphaerae bacterium]|nr:LmbE family protein [Lentisphaerota bacterium]MCP4103050.1 LmbE family protein [Lentisphaerota bacterium]